ncbi:hypothetical protein [Leptolyngbya sp. FACHB-16]|uniref:hypothetical protein n=1 Tax=unclassified Leptolyngbya TaxID=2650499 RepID=UPI001689A0E6|nr:hypothetical protein [Leptolyngbya sp. FACHB-16]MBD2152940.1 hypothetical protein [Leptolyngbya sp. FACHB-16]
MCSALQSRDRRILLFLQPGSPDFKCLLKTLAPHSIEPKQWQDLHNRKGHAKYRDPPL